MEELITQLLEVMELEEGDLTPETRLTDLEEWDSLAMVTCIGIAEDKFEKDITGDEIAKCTTVADIYKLMVS